MQIFFLYSLIIHFTTHLSYNMTTDIQPSLSLFSWHCHGWALPTSGHHGTKCSRKCQIWACCCIGVSSSKWDWPYCTTPGQLSGPLCAEQGSFSELLRQSSWNPVNLAAQSAMAKTASDAPYLLTERDLAQRVCLTWLTGEAFHSWRVYGSAGFRPTCISTCKSRANDGNLKSLFVILAVVYTEPKETRQWW